MKSPFLVFLTSLILAVAVSAQSQTHFAMEPSSAGANGTPSADTRQRYNDRNANLRRPDSAEAASLERRVFDLLNAERRARGLADLEWSDEVAAVARLHSQNMAAQQFFSHRGSDGSMVDDRADRVGLGQWRSIGENIAYMRGYDDPATLAVEKWMESTAHRKNLLGPNWKESAVGVSITSNGTYYMTQVFLVRK